MLSVFFSFNFDNGLIPHSRSFVTQQIYHSSGNVGKTKLTLILFYSVSAVCDVIVNNARNAVESMRGLGNEIAVLILLGLTGLLIHFKHFVSVTVVGGNKRNAAKAINKFVDMLEDLEDVQDVYTNMETTDEVDAALEAEG